MNDKELAKMKKDCTDMLVTMDCLVEFTKVDGSNRKMLCTLRKDAVPESSQDVPHSRQKFRNRAENKEILIVWDLEAGEGEGGWRSMRLDKIRSFVPAV